MSHDVAHLSLQVTPDVPKSGCSCKLSLYDNHLIFSSTGARRSLGKPTTEKRTLTIYSEQVLLSKMTLSLYPSVCVLLGLNKISSESPYPILDNVFRVPPTLRKVSLQEEPQAADEEDKELLDFLDDKYQDRRFARGSEATWRSHIM
jgi:hypothetical protein